jgi:hypothetical protein
MKTTRRIKISFTTREILASPADIPEKPVSNSNYHSCPVCHSPLVEGESPAVTLLLEEGEPDIDSIGTYSILEEANTSEGD